MANMNRGDNNSFKLNLDDKEISKIDRRDTETEEDAPISNLDNKFIKKSRGVLLMSAVKDLVKEEGPRSKAMWIIVLSVWFLSWSLSLDNQTTSNYEVYAASDYGHHSLISTLGIASSIISAVGQLCFAKFADITSRPITYIFALLLYVIGYIIIPAGSTISSYIVGVVFGDLGRSILDLTNTFIVGDLTPLKWRCFGLGVVDSPNIVNPWFAGLIVNNIVASNWRWGYGMFTIIVPLSLIPAIASLVYYQKKASRIGIVQEKADIEGISVSKENGSRIIGLGVFKEIDIIGLLLLATSLALILLPLSLYETADKGWKNPSIIAMFIVGGVLLVTFVLFEIYFAPYPCIHKRNFNRTVITEVIFNIFYFMSSNMRKTYLSSFVLIYKDWNTRDWTYYVKSVVVSKCLFGLVAGLILRRTRHYKYLQIIGISIEIIGAGLLVSITDANTNTATLVMSQILSGMGGGLSVYSSRTAIQAAVPHQNMTMAITTLVLFSSIGSAIGSAIAGVIWSSKTPTNLRKYMPSNITDEQVQSFFGNVKLLRKYPMGSTVRNAAINAYIDTVYYLFVPALGILFISFIVCFFQKNYYLGDGQNAVEPEERNDPEGVHSSDFVDRILARLAHNKKERR